MSVKPPKIPHAPGCNCFRCKQGKDWRKRSPRKKLDKTSVEYLTRMGRK